MKRYFLIMIALLLIIQTACIKKPDADAAPATTTQPLLSLLKNNYTFSMFYNALLRTGLDKMLQGKGQFTLLVPDNDAFARSGITQDSLAKMDTALLHKVIGYHIIASDIPYAAIPRSIDYQFKSITGLPVYFSVPLPVAGQVQQSSQETLHINGVNVNQADILASNGVIHDLNNVLQYPSVTLKSFLQASPNYSYFTQALKQFGMLDQLDKPGPFVVFAPSNDVFMQHGIDQQGIAALDTLTYKKLLFEADVLPGLLFFTTDLNDAPANTGYIGPDFVTIFSTNSLQFGVAKINFAELQNNPLGVPVDIYYGDQPSITDPNHLALNGVLHGVNGLAVLPDSVKIHK